MRDQRTVLFVDDEESVRLLLQAIFEVRPYRLLECDDGTEALALVWRERPDVVLLDVVLPRLDGYEVCRALKGDVEDGRHRRDHADGTGGSGRSSACPRRRCRRLPGQAV